MHHLITTLILVCVCSATAAVEDKDRYADSYAKEAAGDLARSINAIEPLLHGARSQDYLLNLRLGWLHYRSGMYKQSVNFYQVASQRCPNALEPHLGCILPLMAQRNWSEVERRARLVLRSDAGNYTANRWLTESLLAQDKTREAADIAERLAERFPADATATELVARSRWMKGDKATAREAYARLQLLDPGNAAAAAALAAK